MTSNIGVRYPRAPSDELRKLLKKGFLGPIWELPERQTDANLHLDVHFRSNDHIQVYLGSARILDISARPTDAVNIGADEAYTKHSENLFREWETDESGFEKALQEYLDEVADKFPSQKEGKVQELWSRACNQPWTTFDREASLSYKSTEQRINAIRFAEVESARKILREIARTRPNRYGKSWKEPPKKQARRQVDQLGIDENGKLVLVELKDARASDESSVFYSPLQLLGYIHEWNAAVGTTKVRTDLDAVIEARRDLGLMATDGPLDRGIRAAICFGDDARSEEVKRRYYEVLGVVNSHRPAGVPPIETWIWPEGSSRPQSL